MRAIHPRTLDELADAVREIQHMAGFTAQLSTSNGAATSSLAVGITSPRPGAGKSTIATALAAMLSADLEVDVALVDADFEGHTIDEDFGLAGAAGFTDILDGTAGLDEASHSLPQSTLRVVPLGTRIADGARVARAVRVAEFVRAAKEENRFVVFDLPSALVSTTAPTMARLCDSVIIVARVGQTTTMDLERSVQRLKDAPIAGVVLNRWRTRIPGWLDSALALGR